MKKRRKKQPNGIAKALQNPAFHQRVKPNKKKVQTRRKKIDPLYPI